MESEIFMRVIQFSKKYICASFRNFATLVLRLLPSNEIRTLSFVHGSFNDTVSDVTVRPKIP